MRLKYLPFVIIAILLAGTITATRPKSITESLRPASVSPERKKEKVRKERKKVIIKDDTLYCRTFRDCMGWPVPLDTINNKDARKAGNVIRLSNRNKAGHFSRVEFLSLNLKPRGEFYTPGILEFYPDSMKQPAVENMEISRVDFLSNSSGERVLEERYYDINNQLLMFTVRHTLNNYPLTVDEFYFRPNGLGMPLIKTEDSTNQIQRLVIYPDNNTKISRIHQGRWPVLHPDGASMIKHTYNPADKSIRMQYLDYYMNPMIATNSVAGQTEYYGKNGLPDSVVFIDTDGNPLEARPDCKNPEYGNTYKMIVSYNKLGLAENIGLFRLNGEPARNRKGAHRFVVKYDSVGQFLLMQAFDSNGNPALFDETNWASQEIKYDSCGNIIEYHLSGTKGEPIPNGEGMSSFYRTYNQSGLLTSLEYSPGNEGTEYLSGQMEVFPDSTIAYFENDVRYVVRYDSLKRIVSARYISETGSFDPSQTPVYSRFIYGDSLSSIQEYDADGNLQALSVVDSFKHTIRHQFFDSEGLLKESAIEQHSKDWERAEELMSINRYGVPCHRTSPDGTQYFRMSFKLTLNGEMYDYHGIDEFGEDDYMIFYDYPAVYVCHNTPRFSRLPFLDEDMKAVDTSTINRLPKYMSIEVTDSLAYNLGIKDNDLILAYGPEYVVRNTTTLVNAISGWTVAETTLAGEEKDMTIFRIDSVSPEKCSLRTIRLPKGRTKDLGFVTHLTYKTRKQEDRIRRTKANSDLFAAKADSDSLAPVFTMDYLSAHRVDLDSLSTTESGHGILLKAEFSKIPEWTWSIGENIAPLDTMLGIAIELNDYLLNADIHCRYTVFDGKHILQFTDSLKNAEDANVPYKGNLKKHHLSQLVRFAEEIPDMEREFLPEEIKVQYADLLWNFFRKSAVEIYESYQGELTGKALERLIQYYSNDCKDKKKVKQYKKQAKTAHYFFEGIDINKLEGYY